MEQVTFKDAKGNTLSDIDVRKMLGLDNKAALEESGSMSRIMNSEILGVPVVQGIVGGTVAELVAALTNNIPQLSSLTGGNVMVTDLLLAALLGFGSKKLHQDWMKYGAMFLVFAAFQSQIQSLVNGVTKGIGSTNSSSSTANAGLAQGDSIAETPAIVERWLRS